MARRDNKPKKTNRRHQPQGLSIIHEDRDIIVVDKECGLLTMSNEKERERTAYSFLNDYVRKGVLKSRNRVFIVHRLDRETSGVLVFAKHEDAANFLQDEWQSFHKMYYAIVQGQMPQSEATIESYLMEQGVHKMVVTMDKSRGKLAKTRYRVLKATPQRSLLEIDLLTGRKHQIRVHLCNEGCPILGDKKYGSNELGIKRLTLHASSMTITHPYSKKMMTFTAPTPPYFESLMSRALMTGPTNNEQP